MGWSAALSWWTRLYELSKKVAMLPDRWRCCQQNVNGVGRWETSSSVGLPRRPSAVRYAIDAAQCGGQDSSAEAEGGQTSEVNQIGRTDSVRGTRRKECRGGWRLTWVVGPLGSTLRITSRCSLLARERIWPIRLRSPPGRRAATTLPSRAASQQHHLPASHPACAPFVLCCTQNGTRQRPVLRALLVSLRPSVRLADPHLNMLHSSGHSGRFGHEFLGMHPVMRSWLCMSD